MGIQKLLVANRGEIAIRILRAASELGLRTVAVHSEDDATSLHTRKADELRELRGSGARAYLDADQIVSLARDSGCDAIHPGYGFLSENADFAARCEAAGLVFVGPRPETLALFGDKARARELARECGVPLLPGTAGPSTLEEIEAFRASQGEGATIVVKALAGGGGRGIRIVAPKDDLAEAYARCSSEAEAAFGNGELYAEQLLAPARHVEIQILGDATGEVQHLFERECTLQRRNQKLVEIAPSPSLDAGLRRQLCDAALRMARAAGYRSLGTFEFLVSGATTPAEGASSFAFMEANPRLQVEHTVTEAVTGVDLVQTQLRLAMGDRLAELGLADPSRSSPRGHAVQVRINMERMGRDGGPRPSGGTFTSFEPPSGPGVRVDTYGYAGYRSNPRFDSLLAKVITHSRTPDVADALRRAYRALCEFRIEGVETNIGFLQSLLSDPRVLANQIDTRFVDRNIRDLVDAAAGSHRRLFFESEAVEAEAAQPTRPGLAGARIDAGDPLAVLDHGKQASPAAGGPAPARPPAARAAADAPEGTIGVDAPLQGTVISIDVEPGESVRRGQALLVLEAMKMEHLVTAPVSGTVQSIAIATGDAVFEGHPLIFLSEHETAEDEVEEAPMVDLDHVRPDLAEVIRRHEIGLDAARPDAVARRRKTGQRTARENIEDLCDPGSFVEYGAVVIAAQRRRRPVEELIEKTPADGMLAGVASINGALFADRGEKVNTQAIVMSYDYTVLAGTQGAQNHRKKDRMFELAERWRLPLVFFTEGGGGRPGDTDGLGVSGLDCLAFAYFGRLSGLVPLVGITSGRCFAGNAALLGCCDVVIATEGSNIGMGGPAMIEGGGLGIFRPEEVGPMDVQVPNGVVDIAVADEREAVAAARQYLSYFQGPTTDWRCEDQRKLRNIIPENRLRIYDVRSVIETLADEGSVLELRRGFGPGMVTALARIEGRPIGIVANNPIHLAGAIDSDGADKASRFMQLCDAHDLPLLFLCDTPGIMVGPEAEKTGLVRHASRMFVTGASVSVPFFTIVLRKSYGLGAQAMAGGSFKAPFFTVSWPTGEFGGMGLEGAVKLGFRKEIAAVEDPEERRALFQQMVDRMYEHGKAVNAASHFEIDDVIDPMDSRRWITTSLRSLPPPIARSGKRRPCIDTW